MNRFTRRRFACMPFLPLISARLAGAVSFVTRIGGASIEVQVVDGEVESSEALSKWVDLAAQAVSKFYGRFPVDRVLLLVQAREAGSAVADGITFPGAPPFINVTVRANATAEELATDWILTHEFIHLAFPSLPRPHHWLEEGLSTYVEPLARTQAGQIEVSDYWRGLIDSLPQGQPNQGDGGLDGSRARLRTYWGGALFCFAADLALRRQLGPAHGLQDALQLFVREQATIDTAWPIQKALQFVDKRLGVPVLEQLYANWATKPVRLDLDHIWRDLGIQIDKGRVKFDDSAPQAEVRLAITTPA